MTSNGVGPDEFFDEWIRELAHRAEDPGAVRAAVAARLSPFSRHRPDISPDASAHRLSRLDPLRDRPWLADDPDGAVVVDVLLIPLSAPPTDYLRLTATGDPGGFPDRPRTLGEVERLLALESLYATPECRVRLEGRGRYNLAFHAARLRAGR
jgi:hypothetical protein